MKFNSEVIIIYYLLIFQKLEIILKVFRYHDCQKIILLNLLNILNVKRKITD